MYKFTSHLSNGKLVLVRKRVGEGTCALVVMRTPNRRYAGGPPPQPTAGPPRQKSKKVFWGTIGASILTGAAVVYAKHDPDARNWLATNVPLADDFVAFIYQERKTFRQVFVNKITKIDSRLTDFFFGREGISPPNLVAKPDQNLDADAAKKYAPKEYGLPKPAFEPLYVEELTIETPEIESPATLIQTDKCDPPEPPTINVTKDIVDLEHDMHQSVKAAVENYKKATTFCGEYNQALYKIIEYPVDELDKTSLSMLTGAQTEMTSHAKKASAAAAKAKMSIDTLDRMIKAGIQAPPEVIASTLRYMKIFREDLAVAEKKYKDELEKSVISDKYWHKVEEAREVYKEELQLLFPGIDLAARRLNVQGDTDLLLIYTLKQIQFLQNQIAEIQTVREQKLSRAIECHDEKEIIEAKVEDIIKKEKIEREREYQKRSLAVQAEAAKQLRDQLKKQMEIQHEILQDRLAKKEKEVLAKFNKSVSEQVEKERILFKQELAAMAGKLRAIEQSLKQRAASEAETRRSQALWAAAEALLAATRRNCPETKIDKELQAIEKVGRDDRLVQTVLKGIPKEVRDATIVTERSLRERFDRMERIALKVALVGKDGASLPIYLLSWIQSKLLFSRISEIPRDELENKPTDFTSLDTFDIMQRARFYMDHGNLPAALRYVNLLQGASRAAAKAWAEAARRHLEIRQAAEAVMAHASAASLLHFKKM